MTRKYLPKSNMGRDTWGDFEKSVVLKRRLVVRGTAPLPGFCQSRSWSKPGSPTVTRRQSPEIGLFRLVLLIFPRRGRYWNQRRQINGALTGAGHVTRQWKGGRFEKSSSICIVWLYSQR
jgi:hypothetical protein